MSFRSDTGWKKGIFGLEENVDVEEERESRYASLEFEFSRCLFEFDDLHTCTWICSVLGTYTVNLWTIRNKILVDSWVSWRSHTLRTCHWHVISIKYGNIIPLRVVSLSI